jgi:hypothetical protein
MSVPSTVPGWRLLVISLPSGSATARMRVWRALKASAAAVLRDGVYLLPAGAVAERIFAEQAREVQNSRGSAQVLTVHADDAEQNRVFLALFDRTPDYARVMQATQVLKAGASRRRATALAQALKRVHREYAAIRTTDYFPGPAAEQAGQLLAETEAAVTALTSPGEPQAQAGRIARLDRKEYRHRTWATRARPWVDRMASAWLIKRFIDPRARFVWLKKPKDCPRRALGFDFDGAAFTHIGARVTFEVLLASFGLEADRGLVRLGQLVHFLDVGGVPVPEAAGVETILAGARRQHKNDDRLLAEAVKTFDYLYHAYAQE